MKKQYQIESQRAMKQLEAMAADGNPAVQMVLPLAEMVGWLRQGVGELIRQAGLRLMDLLMQEEVREQVGERSLRQAEKGRDRHRAEERCRDSWHRPEVWRSPSGDQLVLHSRPYDQETSRTFDRIRD